MPIRLPLATMCGLAEEFGSNVVIGGGSVVVKDIPSDCVAVGNPCKPIRKITDEDMKTCFDKSMNK